MSDRTGQLDTAFGMVDRLLAARPPARISDNDNTHPTIRWHEAQADTAEREASTAVAQRRRRLLSAARYHRDCADLAREELS